MADFVYVFTNPFMPRLCKIGITNDLETRLKSLYTTGVPVPFECYFAGQVNDARLVEQRFHKAFDDKRVNKSREFFEIEPEKVVAILELLVTKDATPKNDVVETPDDQIALDKARVTRSRVNLFHLGLKIGDELSFYKDDSVKATILSENKIMFEGAEHSLSSAAMIALKRMGYNWVAVQGTNTWKFNDKLLTTIRNELEDQI